MLKVYWLSQSYHGCRFLCKWQYPVKQNVVNYSFHGRTFAPALGMVTNRKLAFLFIQNKLTYSIGSSAQHLHQDILVCASALHGLPELFNCKHVRRVQHGKNGILKTTRQLTLQNLHQLLQRKHKPVKACSLFLKTISENSHHHICQRMLA